jgi:hypothetical protein
LEPIQERIEPLGRNCDLIILEMMYDPGRIPPALDAALATKLSVWFGASARRGRDGRPISFHSPRIYLWRPSPK